MLRTSTPSTGPGPTIRVLGVSRYLDAVSVPCRCSKPRLHATRQAQWASIRRPVPQPALPRPAIASSKHGQTLSFPDPTRLLGAPWLSLENETPGTTTRDARLDSTLVPRRRPRMCFGCSWDFCCSSRPAWSLGTDGAEVLPQTTRPVGPDGHHGNDHDARASPRFMSATCLLIATQLLFHNRLEGLPFSCIQKAGRFARAAWVFKIHLAPDISAWSEHLDGIGISCLRDRVLASSGISVAVFQGAEAGHRCMAGQNRSPDKSEKSCLRG